MFSNEIFRNHIQHHLKEMGLEKTEIRPLPSEEVFDLYRNGFRLYEMKNYEEALTIFKRLVLSYPLHKECWQAFAGALQMTGRFQEATSAWAVIALLDPQDPYPHFHVTECYIALGKTEEAQKALNMLMSMPEAQTDPFLSEKIEELCE